MAYGFIVHVATWNYLIALSLLGHILYVSSVDLVLTSLRLLLSETEAFLTMAIPINLPFLR